MSDTRESLLEKAKRLSIANQELMAKLIKSLDSELKPDPPAKERPVNGHQSQGFLRRSASHPF